MSCQPRAGSSCLGTGRNERILVALNHELQGEFRRSAATLLIENGIGIRMVQPPLGCAKLRTIEIYVKVSNHALQRADILDALAQ